jgi:hypothetical protein
MSEKYWTIAYFYIIGNAKLSLSHFSLSKIHPHMLILSYLMTITHYSELGSPNYNMNWEQVSMSLTASQWDKMSLHEHVDSHIAVIN